MIQFCLKLGNGSFHRIALLLLVMGLIPMSERLFGQTNPLAPAYGFNIFVQNNVSIGPADVEEVSPPVAILLLAQMDYPIMQAMPMPGESEMLTVQYQVPNMPR